MSKAIKKSFLLSFKGYSVILQNLLLYLDWCRDCGLVIPTDVARSDAKELLKDLDNILHYVDQL